MDSDTASHFVSSLIQSIQALCHGYVQFNSSIEVIGHIYLNVDKGLKFNYIVNEEVNKDPHELTTVFHTNSYHSLPPTHLDHPCKACEEKSEVKTDSPQPIFPATPVFFEPLKSKSPHDTGRLEVEKKDSDITHNDAAGSLPEHKTSLVSSNKKSRKRKHSKATSQKEKQVTSSLNPVVVIKREPVVESGNSFIVRNVNSGEEHTIIDDTLINDVCKDAVSLRHSDPYPVIMHRNVDDTEVEQLACDVAAFQCDSGDGSQVSRHNQSSKSFMAQFKHQIVEYAEFVGNRPAARHFGVHESTIRHWRKKLGRPGSACPRGRRRSIHTPLPQFKTSDLFVSSGLQT